MHIHQRSRAAGTGTRIFPMSWQGTSSKHTTGRRNARGEARMRVEIGGLS